MEYGLVGAILAMVSFSFILMPVMAGARFWAVKMGKMKPGHFKFMKFEGEPELVTKTTRHWMNLYEVPILFYVLCLLCLQLNLEDQFFANLAWAYVGARLIHAVVHTTYNHVMHRFFAFFTSNIILLIFFIRMIALAQN